MSIPKINEWISQFVENECQLFGNVESFVEGWDYGGKGPWFDWVATEALRTHYEIWMDENYPQEDRVGAYKVTGVLVRRYPHLLSVTAKLSTPAATNTRSNRTIIRFGSLIRYKKPYLTPSAG